MPTMVVVKIRIMPTTLNASILRHNTTVMVVIVLLLGLGSAWAAASPTQPPEAVETLVMEYLGELASSYPGQADITVNAERVARYPLCSQLSARLPRGQRLRSRTSVEVRCQAPETWKTRVPAEMAIHGYYYVPNRPVEAGDTLSLDDLIGREGDILSLGRGVAIDPSRIIGHIAIQRIPQGVPIKLRALRSPESIPRGRHVRIEAHGRGFVITGEGQAMQAGAPGDRIRVRTPSGRIVTGTIIDSTTVSVTP